MNENGAPHPIDVTVGERVRRARIARGLSQVALAERLDVSFQQIQKYENGANRISASRLVEIADVLQVPATDFLKGLGAFAGQPGRQAEPPGAQDLMAYYAQLPPPMRAAVLDLARSLAEGTSNRRPAASPRKTRRKP